MEKKFPKEDLLKISPFKELASNETYAKHFDTIVNYIQMGGNLPPTEVVGMLYKTSCHNAGISATGHSILFCFAQGVLNANDDLKKTEDVDEIGVYLPGHYERFYPEYKGEFENFEPLLLDPAEEWFYSFKMWQEGLVPEELKQAFFYGMYCYFKKTTELFDFVDEEFLEKLAELEEDDFFAPNNYRINYQFSHQILRELFFEDPDNVFQEVKSTKDGSALLQLVAQGMYFAGKEKLQDFLKGITLHSYNCPEFDACILHMPEPSETTEPFFIALVKYDGNGTYKYRYFLLEASIDGNGKVSAFLCEWTEGRHVLHSYWTTEFSLQEFINGINTVDENFYGKT